MSAAPAPFPGHPLQIPEQRLLAACHGECPGLLPTQPHFLMEAPAPCLDQSLPGRPKWGNPSQGSGSRALPLGWALPPCLSLICTGSCAALGTSCHQTQGHCEGQLDTLQVQSSKMPPPKALAWPPPLVPQSPHFLPHVGPFCPRLVMAGPSLRPQPQQVGTPRRDPVTALALAPGGGAMSSLSQVSPGVTPWLRGPLSRGAGNGAHRPTQFQSTQVGRRRAPLPPPRQGCQPLGPN